jgi:signal transduction histidine kinase/ActR/RegA family two-component response regulator
MGTEPNRVRDPGGVLRQSWRDFVTSGIPEDPFSPYMRRVRFLNQFLLTTVVALLLFGVYHLFFGSLLSAGIEIAIGLLGAASILYIRKTGNLDRAQKLTLSSMLVMMVYLLVTGGIGGTGIFWWFTLPAGAFFLGRRFARWWMAGTIFMILLAMGLAAGGFLALPYSLVFLRQFLASLVVVSLLVYFYETIREDYEELIERHSQEIVSTNTRLHQEVSERQRAQEELEAAQQEAERANRAKSEFLSRMSHELRTPLNSILGFSQLLDSDLSKPPLTPTQREYVQLIYAGGQHLLSLINEVLDLSRIESGRISLDPQLMEVASVVAEAHAVVKPLADARRITLRDETAGASLPRIVADPYRLKQILLNLLSNAIKYNREGGLVVVESVRSRPGFLRISVTDTGPGIPPEQQSLLFEPFQRLSADRSGIEGTGIGLAIARKLSDLMGGAMGLTSTPGLGSCFYVDLPVEEGNTPTPAPEAPAGRASEEPASGHPSGEGGTVLYVEDDTANLTLARHILARRPGVQLLAATQGQDGIDLALAHHPALILLDIHLPDMDGHEVYQRLQLHPETSGIPVVIVSASAMPSDIERLMEAGVSGYLTKPFDLAKFLATVDEFLAPAPPGVPDGASR